jgi:hypothetical protein
MRSAAAVFRRPCAIGRDASLVAGAGNSVSLPYPNALSVARYAGSFGFWACYTRLKPGATFAGELRTP